ncbi:hypothetical protein AB0J40_02205 [Amycolatopsis sp. NPDC049691]|uniref:hypothetical protein n=1 Tax=Amycolatopsis sp. NPDC049691 TaxID=3155155 RepID=UPI0034262B05
MSYIEGDLYTPVEADERHLLRVIFEPLREHGKWPTWRYVDRTFRATGRTTEAHLSLLPVIRLGGPSLREYGLVRFSEPQRTDRTTVSLTVAAGLHLPEFRPYSEFFLRILRLVIARLPEAPFEVPPVTLSAAELKKLDGSLDDAILRLVPELFHAELAPLLNDPAGPRDGDEWSMTLNPAHLDEFTGVTTIEDYLVRLVNWLDEAVPELPEEAVAPRAHSPGYADDGIIARLDAAQTGTRWDLTKLLTLLRELNANHRMENTYATHTLLRAILDHVPPIFGKGSFKSVAEQYAWGVTDKKYIKRLEEFRAQGDDALHRMIRERQDILAFDDLPPRMLLNRLLDEVVAILTAGRP